MSQFDDRDGVERKSNLKQILINLAESNMTDDQIRQHLKYIVDAEAPKSVFSNSQFGDH